jgi:3-dehydroquinate synthetase
MLHRIVEPVRQRGMEAFRDSRYIEAICKDCIEVKAPTLDHYHSSDFNEMCPQYGHAVGHAIEFISWETDFPLLHGEAVAIGMCVSAEIALRRGLCTQEIVDQHYDACLTLGLPAFVPSNITIPQILQKIVYDKHFVKCPAMGLCADIGLMAINPQAAEKPVGAMTESSSTTSLSTEQSKPEPVSFAFSIAIDELEIALQANMDRMMATPAADTAKTFVKAPPAAVETPILSANETQCD